MAIRAASKTDGKRSHRWHQMHRVLSDSLVNFFNDDSLTISASIAYYSLLCIFPFLLLVIGLGGVFIRQFELAGRLAIILDRYLPMKPDFIMQNLESISRSYGSVSLISFALLLWSSSGVFMPLETALNRAWDVAAERSWWRKRVLALEMALIIGLLILVSSVLISANVHFHNWLRGRTIPIPAAFVDLSYYALFIALTFGMSLAMFLLIFGRLPNRPLQIRQVLPSALVTAIFWEGARSLFTLLLPRFNYRHVYGSIAVVVALMTWAYISSVVILFGAQVSRALYRSLEANETSENGRVVFPV